MIAQILNLEPNKVSKDIKDYDLLLYGESGIGKSEFVLDLYGKEKTIALAFEDSYKGIDGSYAVNIDSYPTLTAYMSQLENPKVREKFDTVVIDTLYLLDYCIEKSICDAYGVELLGDALKYNKAYKIVDRKFLGIIKRLKKMGYTLVYVAHPVTKKIAIGGAEIEKFEPKVSERIKSLLLPEIDVQLFCYTDVEGNRKIATQKSQYWNARCRVAEVAPCIDFDADTFREEFKKGIELKESKTGLVVDKREVVKEEEKSYEEVMAYLNDVLAKKCAETNKLQEANVIITNNLGRDNDGNVRTLASATPEMIDALKAITIELEVLLEK